MRAPRHRVPLAVVDSFRSIDPSEGYGDTLLKLYSHGYGCEMGYHGQDGFADVRGHTCRPDYFAPEAGAWVAYNVGSEGVIKVPPQELFIEQDVYGPYFRVDEKTDLNERYDQWRVLSEVDKLIHSKLDKWIRIIQSDIYAGRGEIRLFRNEQNDLRKALFLFFSLWSRDRNQHLLKSSENMQNARRRHKEFRKAGNFERFRDVWVANVWSMLQSEHFEIAGYKKIFDLDREDYHGNARERFMVIYKAPEKTEFLCTDTSFGVYEETELGADESRMINMKPLEYESRVYTRDHAWHQIFIISPQIAIVLCHGSLMNPELTKAHRNRYGLRPSVLESLPHPVPANYYKDLTRDQAGFIRPDRKVPQEVLNQFGIAAWDNQVVAIEARNDDELRFPVVTLDTKGVSLINSILLQNQAFNRVDNVLFRWPDAHDSILDALDKYQKLCGEGRASNSEEQNDYKELRRSIEVADENRSRPPTAMLPPAPLYDIPPPPLHKIPPPPPLALNAGMGRPMPQRRKSVHHESVPSTPLTVIPPVPRMADTHRHEEPQTPRTRAARAQTHGSRSTSSAESTKASERPVRRETISSREPSSTDVPRAQATREIRPPPPPHRESIRREDLSERPQAARRDSPRNEPLHERPQTARTDSAKPVVTESVIAEMMEAADQRAWHATQLADEARREKALEEARRQKFEARKLEAELKREKEDAAREKARREEATRRAAEEEARRSDEVMKHEEARRQEEARRVEDAKREEQRKKELEKIQEARAREEARIRAEAVEARRREVEREEREARRRAEEAEEAKALAESARLREIRLKKEMEQRQERLRRQEQAEQEAARERTRLQEQRAKQATLEAIQRRKEQSKNVATLEIHTHLPIDGHRSPGRTPRTSRPDLNSLQVPLTPRLRLDPPEDDRATRISDASSKVSKASSSKSDTRVPSSKTSNSDADEPKTPLPPARTLFYGGKMPSHGVAESMIVNPDDDDEDLSQGDESWEDEGYSEGRTPVKMIIAGQEMRRVGTADTRSSGTARGNPVPKVRSGRKGVRNYI